MNKKKQENLRNKHVGGALLGNPKANKAITLIALIITIIVMLILVAVTVNIAVNSGLFGHAKDATNKWADEQNKEANIGDEVDILVNEHVVGKYYVDIVADYSITLADKEKNGWTTFTEAYIKDGNENIDITHCICTENDESYGEVSYIFSNDIAMELERLGRIEYWYELDGMEKEVILSKDGKEYSKIITIAIYNEVVVDNFHGTEKIVLRSPANAVTTFTEAYIKYNGEKINLSDIIYTADGWSCIHSGDIANKLYNLGYVENRENILGTKQEIIIIKDGIAQSGLVTIYDFP